MNVGSTLAQIYLGHKLPYLRCNIGNYTEQRADTHASTWLHVFIGIRTHLKIYTQRETVRYKLIITLLCSHPLRTDGCWFGGGRCLFSFLSSFLSKVLP